jgi:hypothetical protein
MSGISLVGVVTFCLAMAEWYFLGVSLASSGSLSLLLVILLAETFIISTYYLLLSLLLILLSWLL